MVQLKILSGRKAGSVHVARHFPFHVGRSPDSDLQLEEQGIWDDHLQIEFKSGEGFLLKTHYDALVTINSKPTREKNLRSGDLIEMGSLKIQFWLSEVSQRGFRIRECFVWTAIAAIFISQIVLIYWLLG